MDSGVIISHRKRQSPSSLKPEDQFEFEWHLKMTFSPKLQSMDEVALSITNLTYGDQLLPKKKDDVQRIFGDLLESPTNQEEAKP
jgi:hypothetical protein